ncbi:MAG: hypothetical protein KAY24_14440 [Candidatus Eisenbacteria sp.]|nr:hypothetical protein [Candidatus Eisenbacteria bacterium]
MLDPSTRSGNNRTARIINHEWIPALLSLFVAISIAGQVRGEVISIDENPWPGGISVRAQGSDGVEISYEMTSFSIEPVMINGASMQIISIPGIVLPSDAGAPNLPTLGLLRPGSTQESGMARMMGKKVAGGIYYCRLRRGAEQGRGMVLILR